MSSSEPANLRLVTLKGSGRVLLWMVLVSGAFLVVYLATKVAARPVAALSGVALYGAFIYVVLRLMLRLQSPARLELRLDEVVLVLPAFLPQPVAIPRGDVASLVVHSPKEGLRGRHLPSRPAAPIPDFAWWANGSNLTLLFNKLIRLPSVRNIGLRGIPDLRGWKRQGAPVSGLRLRLADPEAAELQLRAWLGEGSAPVARQQDATPPGFANPRFIRRNQLIIVGVVGALLVAVVLSEPRYRQPGFAAATLVSAVAAGVFYDRLLVWAIRRPGRRRIIAGALVVLGWLSALGFLIVQREGARWLLFGMVGGGAASTMLVQLGQQSREGAGGPGEP